MSHRSHPYRTMTPASPPPPPSTSHSSHSQSHAQVRPAPPTRNKSSSALSTHTVRSLSSNSTSSGKPRRNKSSSTLSSHAHHHSAGHHPVSFAHHGGKKSSHAPHTAMKRQGSSSGGARKGGFGLGMMQMTSTDGQPQDGEGVGGGEERDGESAAARPDLGGRRSSSNSTITIVAGNGGERGRGRERSRSRARGEERAMTEERGAPPSPEERQREQQPQLEARPQTPRDQDKERVPGSVTSASSDWESATDSPLAIGKKLPDVERSLQPQGHSALAQALDERGGPSPSRANGRKAKFSLGTADLHDEADESAVEDDSEDEEEAIPSAAMPPAETPVLPAMPATIQAITPARSPQDEEDVRPTAEEAAIAGATALPPPPEPIQHLSPPDPSPLPSRPSSQEKHRDGGGQEEPSLVAAAQPEFAYPNQPPPQPPSRPPSQRDYNKHPTPSHPPSPAPAPAQPTASDPTRPVSPIRPTPHRMHPTRKASNASIASARSHLTMSNSRSGGAPQFRRSASGVAPLIVDRKAARAELTSPGPEDEEAHLSARRNIVGDRPGSRATNASTRGVYGHHSRTASVSSLQSLLQVAEATAPSRRANTLGQGDGRRLRPSETIGGGGSGALAALGNIAAINSVSVRGSPAPGGSEGGGGLRGRRKNEDEDEGALTHAKRSASGYFNAFRAGLSALPTLSATPPLSPSSTAAQRYPIPGSHDRSGSHLRGVGSKTRSSPSPQQPPVIVKFQEPAPPPPPRTVAPAARPSAPPGSSLSSPNTSQIRLSNQQRTQSSASLSHGPLSRTQQKALLARDAPTASPSTNPQPATSAPPTPNPNPNANANGMQKWAFGLIKEAERIERAYREGCERWRDPFGEGLERVLRNRGELLENGEGTVGGSGSSASAMSGGAVSSGGRGPRRGTF
ncbi:hypothetical protein JCM11641_003678 [Rhodosporidiobolus odoratus]